jgi:hypothetical protein
MNLWQLTTIPFAITIASASCTDRGEQADNVGDAAPPVDVVAHAETTDGPFCAQGIDALCAMPNTGCISDWASALRTAMESAAEGGLGCYPGSATDEAEVCGGYNALVQTAVDSSALQYYDMATGMLVAMVHYDAIRELYSCIGGPANFATPPSCSLSSALCDFLADGGIQTQDANKD